MTSKIKDAMLEVFSDFRLPQIPSVNSTLLESNIKKWKTNHAVKTCYGKLFEKVKSHEPDTYMSKIIQILKKKRRITSKLQIAYAISICTILLNPRNLLIQVSESVIKPILTKNFVSI